MVLFAADALVDAARSAEARNFCVDWCCPTGTARENELWIARIAAQDGGLSG
jgi:hypothetical protein